MRREWITHETGGRTLSLWPESTSELELGPVERSFLIATLSRQTGTDPGLSAQIHGATCTCRTLTNYGAMLDLDTPANIQPFLNEVQPAGGALLAWRDTPRYLEGFVWFKEGRLDCLEIVPLDGEGWTNDECIAILAAPLDAVEIVPQGW